VIFSLAKARVTDEPKAVRMVIEASPIPDLSSAKGGGSLTQDKGKSTPRKPTVIDCSSLNYRCKTRSLWERGTWRGTGISFLTARAAGQRGCQRGRNAEFHSAMKEVSPHCTPPTLY